MTRGGCEGLWDVRGGSYEERGWEGEGREMVGGGRKGGGVAVQRLAGGDDHVLTMASIGSAETC